MGERVEQRAGRPVIGIAPDVIEPQPGSVRAACPLTYARAVAAAGGYPVVLTPEVSLVAMHLEMCDGFVLTGGDDPRTESFGAPTHPKATPVHPLRQAFDEALLRGLQAREDAPTLGVCLGMQMMALVAGGSMDQHLPETLATHAEHWQDAKHAVVGVGGSGLSGQFAGQVVSHHRQAVSDPGTLEVVARSHDGVIEAISRRGSASVSGRAMYLGVQWHPERSDDPQLGIGLFQRLVREAAERRAARLRSFV